MKTMVFLFVIGLVLMVSAQNAPQKKDEKKSDNINLLTNTDTATSVFKGDGMKNPPVSQSVFWMIFAGIHVVLFTVFYLRHRKIKKHLAEVQQGGVATAGETQLKNRLAALASEDE